MTKILQHLKDKWPILISLSIGGVLLFFAYGCEPETKSLIDPDLKVNRTQLQSELEFLVATSHARFQDLDRQQQFRDMILQQSILIAETGDVNPVGLLTSIIALLGIGAGADDLRVRKKLKTTLTYDPNVENPS